MFVCGRFGCVTHGLFFARTPPSQEGTRPSRPLILRRATSAQPYKPKVVLRLSGLRVKPSICPMSPHSRRHHDRPRSRANCLPPPHPTPSRTTACPTQTHPRSPPAPAFQLPRPHARSGLPPFYSAHTPIDGLTPAPRTRTWYPHHLAAVSAPAAAEGLPVPANRSGLAHHLPRLVAGT